MNGGFKCQLTVDLSNARCSHCYHTSDNSADHKEGVSLYLSTHVSLRLDKRTEFITWPERQIFKKQWCIDCVILLPQATCMCYDFSLLLPYLRSGAFLSQAVLMKQSKSSLWASRHLQSDNCKQHYNFNVDVPSSSGPRMQRTRMMQSLTGMFMGEILCFVLDLPSRCHFRKRGAMTSYTPTSQQWLWW